VLRNIQRAGRRYANLGESLAPPICGGKIDRKKGLANADAPTHLVWQLHNATQLAAAATPPAVPRFQPLAPDRTPEVSFSGLVLDTHLPSS